MQNDFPLAGSPVAPVVLDHSSQYDVLTLYTKLAHAAFGVHSASHSAWVYPVPLTSPLDSSTSAVPTMVVSVTQLYAPMRHQAIASYVSPHASIQWGLATAVNAGCQLYVVRRWQISPLLGFALVITTLGWPPTTTDFPTRSVEAVASSVTAAALYLGFKFFISRLA